MRKLLVVSAALAALVGSPALAADMAAPVYKAPPPPAPVCVWCGWYVGVNAGGAVNNSTYSVEPAGGFLTIPLFLPDNGQRTASANLNQTSFTGGIQGGYNYQTGMWVWGVETDFNYKGENQTSNVNRQLVEPLAGNFVTSVNEKFDWFGTFRGRVGITPTPTMLIYGTGGLAYGHVSSASNVMFTLGGDTYTGAASATKAGWTAGAGAEWMFAHNWSLKVEYLYVDLGKLSYTSACVATTVCGGITPTLAFQTDLRVRDNIARAGVNMHF